MDNRRPKTSRSEKAMKVAIVHDWLPVVGGAEKVLEQLMVLYPEADLYTLFDFLTRDQAPFLAERNVTHSRLQKVPFSKKLYRHMLPLLPMAIEQFDLSDYDLVISSSSAVAKGVITSPDQLHVCYCHSPMRYAWDLQAQYLNQTGLTHGFKSAMIRYVLYRLRMWDVISSHRVDSYIANSGYIRNRIHKTYRRDAKVIHPPVDISRFALRREKEDFYLAASRQVPYKRIDLIVRAFQSMPDKKLVVLGDGPEHKKIKALAGPNVEILGYQPDPVLLDYIGRAKAFIFAAQEDFGILPVEAQACGTPVIAFGRGGARETVLDKITGLHFEEQTEASLIDAVSRFERLQHNFRPEVIRQHAGNFSIEAFRSSIKAHIESVSQERARAAVQPKPPQGVEHMRKFLR
jgi:glycosyltransferase involved in cell wall biosynthesis